MRAIIQKLKNKKNLTEKESEKMIRAMIGGEMSPNQMVSVLISLAKKGETAPEILGAIRAMRSVMKTLDIGNQAIDTCGTGGDGKGTFNISTTVAFVVVGAGGKVAKHGNRKASSLCGSADVLEELGVNIMLSPENAKKVFENVGLVFLFAQIYHPAMKNVGPVRKKLGIRTIFNYLGPFCNPASTSRQVVGVASHDVRGLLERVACKLNYDHLALVSSDEGMDEVSIISKTSISRIQRKNIKNMIIDPKKYGFGSINDKVLKGGNAKQNAKIIKDILKGKKSANRNVVILNSAVTLYVSGIAPNIESGIKLATDSIDSGRANRTLDALINFSNKYELDI